MATDSFRFDGSDLMPFNVQMAFFDAMMDWTATAPDDLDELLARVEAAWAEADTDESSPRSDGDGGG